MALLVPGADLASADPVADARARAQRLAAELDRLGRRLSMIDESYNQARLAQHAALARVATAEARAAETQRRYDAALVRARDRAVAAYVAGGSMATAVRLPGAVDMRDLTVRREYLRAAAGDDRAAIDGLRAAREDLALERATLASRLASARAAAATVKARRDQAAAAVATQRRLLAQARGELAALVAAEQARRAEAEAATARQARVSRPSPDRASRTRTAPVTTAPPDDATAPPPASSGAAAAVAYARQQLGKPYEWGAAGPDSYDCSGLTMSSWQRGGVSLPHSSRAQYGATTRVPMSALEPGDLLFYGSPIHHVGIYVGGGQMIEASQPGTPVRYASIHRRDLVGIGRPA